MMLSELETVLVSVPPGSTSEDYRQAVLLRNVLGKSTESTRLKSYRHLRELYALDEAIPIFGLLRKLYTLDSTSLPLLALQVAWARDPLLRATTTPVLETEQGEAIETSSLSQALEAAYPNQYSELNRNKIGRNAGSTWTQSGHLHGRAKKIRQAVKPTPVAVAAALFLGDTAGYFGVAVFTNPWCRLLDLRSDQIRTMAQAAHRAGLLNLRAIGEVVELNFPLLAEFQSQHA